MGCGASAPDPRTYGPQKRRGGAGANAVGTGRAEPGDQVVVNGFVCDDRPPACSLGGVGEPQCEHRERPGVIYTKSTAKGFDSHCNALARKPRDGGGEWSSCWGIGQREQSLVDRAHMTAQQQADSIRGRRASAPDRMSGVDGVDDCRKHTSNARHTWFTRVFERLLVVSGESARHGMDWGGPEVVRSVRPRKRGQKGGDGEILRVARLH